MLMRLSLAALAYSNDQKWAMAAGVIMMDISKERIKGKKYLSMDVK